MFVKWIWHRDHRDVSQGLPYLKNKKTSVFYILDFSRRLRQTPWGISSDSFTLSQLHQKKNHTSLSLWLRFCSLLGNHSNSFMVLCSQNLFPSCHWRREGLEGLGRFWESQRVLSWGREQAWCSHLSLLLFSIAYRTPSFLLRSSCCSFWPNSLFHDFCTKRVSFDSLLDRIRVQRLV